MTNAIDCCIPFIDKDTTTNLINQLKSSSCVRNIFLLQTAGVDVNISGATTLSTPTFYGSAMMQTIAQNVTTDYFLFVHPKAVSLGYRALERMCGIAQGIAPAMIYSDNYSEENGQLVKKPKIDLSWGGVRDDFDFGSVQLVSTSQLRESMEEHPDSKCDFGFKHYTIQKAAEKSLDTIKKFVPNPSLGESTILKQFGAETVLATWMVDDGHKFNANVEKINMNGYTAYKVNDYLYLIDSGIEGKHIKELFKKYDEDKGFKPKHIVLFGYSFGMTTLDTLKANIKNVDGIDIHLEIRY